MAKAAWAVVTPPQGSGDKEVSVRSGSEHTGRNARTTVLTFKAANCADVARTVNQAGKPEYVDIADTASSEKTGKVVTISGISNSRKLTFSLGTGDLDIALPDNYTANSVQTTNGTAIPGPCRSIISPSPSRFRRIRRSILSRDRSSSRTRAGTRTCVY